MSKEMDPELEKSIFCLLREIKRYYQTFGFNEDHPDLAKVHSWAVVLEPVTDWLREGLLMYVQDVGSGNKRKEPSAADIYFYADKARIMAKASSAAGVPEYVVQEQTEEGERRREERIEQLYIGFGLDRQRQIEKASQKKKGPLSPEEMEDRKRSTLAAVSQLQKQDLPFIPDPEQIARFEEDHEA